MPRYDLSYETCPGRCAWCWKPLPETDSHAVVRSLRAPPIELRFHHPCWAAYRSLSGIEAGAVGMGGDWTPERVETLRLHTGQTVRAFALALGVTENNYRRLLSGDTTVLGPGVLARVKSVAMNSRFERTDPVDWTEGRAVFCLRMEQGWSLGELAREIGASTQQVQLWQWQGVPVRSVRTHGRLSQVARRVRFDAGMVVDHYLWTHEYLTDLFTAHTAKHSAQDWALAGRTEQGTFRQWLRGTRKIVPESAWHLTQAALRLGLPLPAKGLVPLRKCAWSVERKMPAPEDETRRLEALREAKWTLENVRQLGTVPDRVLAQRLGRTRNSVAIMRRELGIATVDVRTWDGVERPQTVPDEELNRRWDEFRERTKAAKRHDRKDDEV